jgi:hypothetical protein
MTEQELRELLKLIRGVEHFIERCLKSEQEKNELRMQEQLKASGIQIESNTKDEPYVEFDL